MGRRVWTIVGVASVLLIAAAAAGIGSASSGSGWTLSRFAPRTARTWWAILDGNRVVKSAVVRTTNGGRTWRMLKSPVHYVGPSAFVGETAAWIEGNALHPPPSEPLYRTLDGGRSWRRVAERWRALSTIPAPADVQKPGDGGLEALSAQGADITVAVDACCTPDPTTAIAASHDGGRTWRTISAPGRPGYRSAALLDARHWRMSDGVRVSATDDGGRSWRSWAPAVRLKDDVEAPLALSFLTRRLGFAVPDGNGGRLLRTRDGGRTWTPVNIHADG